MKKLLLIGALLIVVAGCAVYTQGQSPLAPEKEITAHIVMQVDSFSALITNRLLPEAQNPKANPERMRQLFLQTRLAYKKFEWAAEYFTPANTRKVNGPAAPETEMSGFVIPPGGLQVIESLLYPNYDVANRQKIVRQLKELTFACSNYSNYFQRATILNWQVWDAAKLQAFRVLTLGITGFDAPLAKSSLEESANSLRSLSTVLAVYGTAGENIGLNQKFSSACAYLENSPGFDNFDRATFITAYGNPLTAAITRQQQRLNIIPVNQRRLLRQNAVTLFDSDAFDAVAYSAYPLEVANADKIALGKKLFNNTLLSGNGTRNCASCHKPELAFTDGLAKNTTMDAQAFLLRNTPTLFNAAFQPAQFADMREGTLEAQAHAVIENKLEMGGSLSALSDRLSADTVYKRLFATAYPESQKGGIGKKEITNAITAYVRTLSVLNSRFDAYMRGDAAAMNKDELNGFNLFMGKAKCGTCHYMPLFNGALPPLYQKMDAEIIGVPDTKNGTRIDDDEGRNSITHAVADEHGFKTPSVRNAGRTAPYMHNGVFTTLDEVIDFYDKGGGAGLGIKVPNQTLSAEQLKLSDKEKQDLVVFIKCLDNQ